MPYIDQDARQWVEPNIDALVEATARFGDDQIEGVMNYVVTELLCRRLKPKSGWRYVWINRMVGILECVKMEFYRRLAGPYEDRAVGKNGDIPSYERMWQYE